MDKLRRSRGCLEDPAENLGGGTTVSGQRGADGFSSGVTNNRDGQPKREEPETMQTKPRAGRAPVEYLTMDQLGEELGVCSRTIRRWRDAGELHAYQIGRGWRISREDANAFMAVRRK
jgi:excisionase family DNA binding protein